MRENPQRAEFHRTRCLRHRIVEIASAALLAITTVLFYRVREMVAALLIFSVLFTIIMIPVLILMLIDELAIKGMIQVEAGWACARAWYAAESSRREADRLLNRPRRA
jgi:hypothetical protein